MTNNKNNSNPKQFSDGEIQRMQNEMTPGHPQCQYASTEPMIDDLDVVSLQAGWDGKAETLTKQHIKNFSIFLQNFEQVAMEALPRWVEATKQTLPHKNFLTDCDVLYDDFSEEITFIWENHNYYNEKEYFSFPTKFLFEPEQTVKEYFDEQQQKQLKKELEYKQQLEKQKEKDYQQYLKLQKRFQGK